MEFVIAHLTQHGHGDIAFGYHNANAYQGKKMSFKLARQVIERILFFVFE